MLSAGQGQYPSILRIVIPDRPNNGYKCLLTTEISQPVRALTAMHRCSDRGAPEGGCAAGCSGEQRGNGTLPSSKRTPCPGSVSCSSCRTATKLQHSPAPYQFDCLPRRRSASVCTSDCTAAGILRRIILRTAWQRLPRMYRMACNATSWYCNKPTHSDALPPAQHNIHKPMAAGRPLGRIAAPGSEPVCTMLAAAA